MLGSELTSTVGFIMNQPVMNIDQTQISRIYGIKSDLPKQPIYCGGPIAMEKITIIHSLDYHVKGTSIMNDQCAITFNEQIARDILQGGGPKNYKIMLGYCTWQDGQLDAELEKRLWLENDYDDIVWANYKRKTKMWRKIIENNATQASNKFLNSLVSF